MMVGDLLQDGIQRGGVGSAHGKEQRLGDAFVEQLAHGDEGAGAPAQFALAAGVDGLPVTTSRECRGRQPRLA